MFAASIEGSLMQYGHVNIIEVLKTKRKKQRYIKDLQ